MFDRYDVVMITKCPSEMRASGLALVCGALLGVLKIMQAAYGERIALPVSPMMIYSLCLTSSL